MSQLGRCLVAAMVVVGVGCTDSADRAAKKRIFSPEDPPKAVASASERLPPEEVADDLRVARRILGMGAAETTERIGPHRFSAKVTFEWSGAGRTTKLVETRQLLAGPGGMAGDFHALLDNSRDQGLEVIRVGGQVFARSRHGKFRQRLRDRGIAEREREELFGAVRDFDALFHGRLALAPQGTVTHEGRTAWRYQVSLGPPPPAAEPSALPPPLVPRGGQDETTKRRLTFLEKRQPQALEGEVLVDAKTSVVLKAHLVGRLAVASEEPAELRMTVESALTEVGKDPGLKPPEQFLPDEDKPRGIADVLERFGLRQSDGGVVVEERPDEE